MYKQINLLIKSMILKGNKQNAKLQTIKQALS